MFRITSRLMVAVASMAVFSGAAFADDPATVPTLFHTTYIPMGFDSNDHVQFVGEGLFRNSCYRPNETQVSVDHLSKKIVIGPQAYYYSGFCMQVLLPFDRVVDVGILHAGNYEVVQDGVKVGSIPINKSTSVSPDDHLYAPIGQAFFDQTGSKKEIVLTGEFSNDCMALKEVRMDIQPNVIVLLPIAEVDNRGRCKEGSFSFSKRIDASNVPAGKFLIHVRSMNAKAVNSLVVVR